tara:strand:+ start:615 stop:1235 length:621 start_codon:yes stop_codon:yes gene_type:complete
MLRDFNDTNLFDIALKKVLKSKVIPRENFFASLYDDDLKSIANNNNVKIYHRSEKSVGESKDTRVVSEWYNKLKFKYYIIINACCPLLRIETIDSFVNHFINSPNESLFAVHEKKNFYWGTDGVLKTKYPGTMDTKLVESVYEAAHCLYAGKMSRIGDGIYLGNFTKNDPELFTVEEKETFDIDYEWQFRVAEVLYGNMEYVLNGQ